MAYRIPKRDIGLWFSLDANRINARQNDKLMNILEKWKNDEVIHLYMVEPAATEARKAGSQNRYKKVMQFSPIMFTENYSTEEQILLQKVSDVLDEFNDAQIVFNAKKYPGGLITEDGVSGKKNSIIVKRDDLKLLGISVYTTAEAVELVRRRIKLRDDMAREYSKQTGESLPEWVGKD